VEWLDEHVRHIAVAVACVACALVGVAVGLSVGGHSVLPVLYHDAPHTVTKTVHGRVRVVTRPGKAGTVAESTRTVTVPTTITTTATDTEAPPPSTVTSTVTATATETTPPSTATTETTTVTGGS
jgi:hypothetical protein